MFLLRKSMDRVPRIMTPMSPAEIPEQTDPVEILARRLSERRSDELADEIREAREDYAAGKCRPSSSAEILKNILS